MRASDDADCYGATGLDFSGEIAAADWVLLPFGLIGALVVADGYQCPVVGDIGELLEEIGCHMATERPAEFGRKVGRLPVISADCLRLALSERFPRYHLQRIRFVARHVALAAHAHAPSSPRCW